MENEAKFLFILTGVAGIGKSTEAKRHYDLHEGNVKTFSSDDYRVSMYGSLSEGNNHNNEIFATMHKDMYDAIKSNDTNVIYDATNLNRRRRSAVYREAKRLNPDIYVLNVYFHEPLNVIMYRNSLRKGEKNVPNDVIKKMYLNQQVPRINVDCDNFTFVGPSFFKEDIDVDLYSINNVRDLMEVMNDDWRREIQPLIFQPHDTKYHLESIDEHIDLVVKNSDIAGIDRTVGLIHDLGKGLAKELTVFPNGDRQSRYIGHENLSASYYMNIVCNTLSSKNTDIKNVLDNIEIIYFHMNAHQGMGEKNIKRNKIDDNLLKRIIDFSKVDSVSRFSDFKREEK